MPQAPRPSATQEITRHNYVSTLDIIDSVHKPEVDPQLTRRYGDENLTGLFRMMGAMNPVSNQEYRHYEKNWLHETIRIDDGTAETVASGNTEYTVAASDIYDEVSTNGAQSPYEIAETGQTILPRVNDVVLFPQVGGVQVRAKVTAIDPSAGTVEFRPLDSGATLPTAAQLAGLEIVIIGNSHNEGSGQPGSRNSTIIDYRNNLSIQKGSHKVTGTEMAQILWFEVNGGWLWYLEGQRDEYRRFMNEQEMMWLFGTKYNNADAADATNTVSEGYFTFVENFGHNLSYSGLTGITESDLENLVKTLEKFRGSKENTMMSGINSSIDVDNLWKGVFDNGAISYGAFNGMQDKAVSMQYDAFKISNYEFYKKVYEPFNYNKMLGAAGQNFQDVMMIMPMDDTYDANGKQVPSLRINYLESGNGYSRYYEEWAIGGANGVYNTDEDSLSIHMRSHTGIEAFAPNKHAILRKA